jgi:hypothetical protein
MAPPLSAAVVVFLVVVMVMDDGAARRLTDRASPPVVVAIIIYIGRQQLPSPPKWQQFGHVVCRLSCPFLVDVGSRFKSRGSSVPPSPRWREDLHELSSSLCSRPPINPAVRLLFAHRCPQLMGGNRKRKKEKLKSILDF